VSIERAPANEERSDRGGDGVVADRGAEAVHITNG
jgi:hypothetical protein